MRANLEAVILVTERAPTADMPMALLSCAGKSILAHRIDEMRALGIDRIAIVTTFQRDIREALADLPLYELDWRISSPSRLRIRGERAMIVSADFMSEPAAASLIAASTDYAVRTASGRVLAVNVSADRIQRTDIHAAWAATRQIETLRSEAQFTVPSSAQDLIDLNLAVLGGTFRVSHISGLKVAPGIHLESLAGIKPANLRGRAHIGEGVSLHLTTRITDCVIGKGATIGANAILTRCIVEPGAVVPAGARLSETIILKSGAVMRPVREVRTLRRAA